MRKTMRLGMAAVAVLVNVQGMGALAGELPLMPWPAQVVQPAAGGALTLDRTLTLNISGDDLGDAATRWRARIARQTGWLLLPQTGPAKAPTIDVTIARKVPATPRPDSDERYRLTVDAAGARLTANTRFGALRGMETVLQLIRNGPQGTTMPYLTIDDAPRFAWRGLLLDTARHYLPVEDIERQLDGMAAAKLNVLHWHLTDDQGWRFASARYPLLQEKASDGRYYSQAQMKAVVRYAAARGIRVVPEIDLPGHASAIAVAYPALLSAPGPYRMERHWGVFQPVLDPTRDATYAFVDGLVTELAAIFPDPYVHIGGDEVDDTQWRANPAIQDFMRKHRLADSHALQAWFNRRVATILGRHRRRMVGWDEIFHPDLPKSILIQSWRGQDALGLVARQGYRGILSTGFYLDQPQYTAYHYRNEIVPSGLDGVDVLSAADAAQSWQFDLPRLKGSAVTGSFTLVNRQGQWRGFIDIKGRSRRAVHDIEWLAPRQLTFRVDTWMGETRPVVTLAADTLDGYFLIGNARYPVTGRRLAEVPAGMAPVVPDKRQQAGLLGGEAALWAENVNAAVLDLRLWPRAFAVAERLWSARAVTDTDDMYRRLQAIDAWATVSVGLRQHVQQGLLFTRLANSGDTHALRILAEAVEPAHYYTRHHLKFRAGHYGLAEPLDGFADALGPESDTVRAMHAWARRLAQDGGDVGSAAALRRVYDRWQDNTADALALTRGNARLAALEPVVRQVDAVARAGLRLVDLLASHGTLAAADAAALQAQLDVAAQTRDEVVIAAVRPVETLLRAARPH